MVVGGVTCRTAHAATIHDRVSLIQSASQFPTDSLQWKHYRDAKWPEYKRLIDYFLEENAAHRIDFSCIVIDTTRLVHWVFNDGDGETFFQKMIFEHVSAMERKCSPQVIRVLHGHRESRYDLFEVRGIINLGLAKHRGIINYRPLKQLDYLRVEHSGPHQLADILLGAVSYHWNPGVRAGGTSRKRRLADYIQAECGADLGKPTPASMKQFDIWKLRLRGDPRA